MSPVGGSITYGVVKELSNIICPFIGQSPHHLRNTQHFVQHIKEVKLEPGKVMTSYDVKALFTSIPVDPSINIVRQKLKQDPLLPTKNQLFQTTNNHTSGWSFVSKNTYFLFQAMGSPISLLIANLFMEVFKSRPLALPHTPHLRLRYMDDTIIQEAKHSQQLLQLQLTGPTYIVHHRGTKPRRSPTFPGPFGFSRSQQHPSHHSL